MRRLGVVLLVAGLLVSVGSSAVADDGLGVSAGDVTNGKIAYQGEGWSAIADIYVVDADGSNRVNLTNTPDIHESSPSFSPDGSRIAYAIQILIDEGLPSTIENIDASLWVMDADGSSATKVTDDFVVGDIEWSPDGQWLAYNSRSDVTVKKVKLDGTQKTTITDFGGLGSWSPDGLRIALASASPDVVTGPRAQIVLVDPDGTNPVQLTTSESDGPFESRHPKYSPDGNTIAFIGTDAGDHLWTMNPDGTGKVSFGGEIRDSGLEWSPDGTQILAWVLSMPLTVASTGGTFQALPGWTPTGLNYLWQFDWQPLHGSFWDDENSVFNADIEWMAAAGITKGCNPPTNDKFCPEDVVTRGQMAAFLVRALGPTERLDNPFADDDDSVFEADIERLAAAGITKGCNPPTNDQFCPDSRVTREVMAAFLVRALHYTDDGGGDLFTDDDDSIFEGDIDRLATAGVTKGCNPPDNDRFCPSGNVTRGQMAAFLHRALG